MKPGNSTLTPTAIYLQGPSSPLYRRDDTQAEGTYTDGTGTHAAGKTRWYVSDGLGSLPIPKIFSMCYNREQYTFVSMLPLQCPYPRTSGVFVGQRRFHSLSICAMGTPIMSNTQNLPKRKMYAFGITAYQNGAEATDNTNFAKTNCPAREASSPATGAICKNCKNELDRTPETDAKATNNTRFAKTNALRHRSESPL